MEFPRGTPWIKYLALPVQNVSQGKAWFYWVSLRYVKIGLNVPHPRDVWIYPQLAWPTLKWRVRVPLRAPAVWLILSWVLSAWVLQAGGDYAQINHCAAHFTVNQVATLNWLFRLGTVNNSLLTLWKMYYPHKLWISVWKGLSLPVAERDVTSV